MSQSIRFIARARAALFVPAFVLAGALPGRAQVSQGEPRGSFTLADSRETVRRIQGAPTLVERLTSLGIETWSYGPAEVTFDATRGAVVAWRDTGPRPADRTLRVSLRPGSDTTAMATMTLGAPAADVIRLHGTPWRIARDPRAGAEYWSYGTSTVRIALADARVTGWWNTGRNLRVTPGDDARAQRAVRARTMATGRALVAAPTAPASLSASVALREPSGNGALDARERATIALTVRNAGPGEARALRASLRPDRATDALQLETPDEIEVLPAGAEATILIPVQGLASLTDGTVGITALVREGNGFDLSPGLRFTVPARASLAPRYVVAGMRVDDQSGDGRLTPREIAEVTVRIANAGAGLGVDAVARLDLGAHAFVTRDSPERYSLGSLAPGASADVSFSLYTNSRATAITAAIVLSDGTGRAATRIPLVLAFDVAVAQTIDAPAPIRVDGPVRPPARAPLADDDERALPRAAHRNPDALAVVLGVERYRTLPPARFAAADARAASRHLSAAFGIPEDRGHLYVRTDADVTGNEFRKLFADDGWLARRVKPTTDVVVFFAGHGAPDLKARTPILLPFDGDASYSRETGYALGVVFEQLARLPARSITVFIDACFSGLTRGSAPLVAGARGIVVSVEHPALARDNMAVFLAARGDQTAGELVEKRQGLFTWHALQGIRGAADSNRDGAITVAELESYLADAVPRAAALVDREQHPLAIARDKSRVLVRLRAGDKAEPLPGSRERGAAIPKERP